MEQTEITRRKAGNFSTYVVLKNGVFLEFKKYQKENIGYVRYACKKFGGEYVIIAHTRAGLITRTVQRFKAKNEIEIVLKKFMDDGMKVWSI